MTDFLANLLQLCLEASPWLLLGLLIGGLIKAVIPVEFLHRHLQGKGLSSVTKAALIGAPLPLCSCGVIPAALGLRKAGASKPATISFLVSTPETGIDSISISYVLLGPIMAITRPIAAITSAIAAGLLAGRFGEKTTRAPVSISSCCNSKQVTQTSCCDSKSNQSDTSPDEKENLLTRVSDGVRYAFTDLFDNIFLWLLVGLIFAAMVKTWVPTDLMTSWGSGLPAMLLMCIIGIPMYVCATASTPIATGLILAGISPGTALVFLLAGPATNISTLGIIGKDLGHRTLIAYLSGVIVVALASGLILDYMTHFWSIDIQARITTTTHLVPHWLAWLALIILFYLGTRNQLKKLRLTETSSA